jgi:hypothetical protein
MNEASHRKRFLVLNFFFFVVLGVLVWRMIDLMVLAGVSFKAKGMHVVFVWSIHPHLEG